MKTTKGTIATWKNHFINGVAEALTPEDYELVEFAKQFAAEKCDDKKHKLAACGFGGQSIEPYSSLQLNVARARESSVCAEAGIIGQAAKKGDEVKTVVTFHGIDENNEPYVVPPCSMCINRLRYFFPECRVVIEHEGVLKKMPIDAFLSLPYPTKH